MLLPQLQLISHVRSKFDHLLNCDDLVTSTAMEPKLEHLLLADVHRVAQLVIINLVPVELTDCNEFQLACKVRNRTRISIQDNFDEGSTVTLTIVEVILDQDCCTNVYIRRFEHQLNILHLLKLIDLPLTSRLDTHKLILEVCLQKSRNEISSLFNSLDLDIGVTLDCFRSVGVLWVQDILQKNGKNKLFISTKHLLDCELAFTLGQGSDSIDVRLLPLIESFSCTLDHLCSVGVFSV